MLKIERTVFLDPCRKFGKVSACDIFCRLLSFAPQSAFDLCFILFLVAFCATYHACITLFVAISQLDP